LILLVNSKIEASLTPLSQMDHNLKDTLVISQPQGLGDIIFSMTLINDWIKKGHKVIWPVVSQYIDIQKHFPDLLIVDKYVLNINHDIKAESPVLETNRSAPILV
jgi:hypothetical protein